MMSFDFIGGFNTDSASALIVRRFCSSREGKSRRALWKLSEDLVSAGSKKKR